MALSRIESLMKSTYRDKGTTFSASQLTKNDYQLWVECHAPKQDRSEEINGIASFIGSGVHLMCETKDINSVIQEFSHVKEFKGVTIGGTCDRLDWIEADQIWELGDYKCKGEYSYKKFKEGDIEKEVMQLSIYRWLYQNMFNISDDATIYLFMLGYSKRSKYGPYEEASIRLVPVEFVEKYIEDKIDVALGDVEPPMDCNLAWQCDYCNVREFCPFLNNSKTEGFSDES